MIPTGVGKSGTIGASKGTHYLVGTWMPDNKHILSVAVAAGHAPATYLQDVHDGTARQVTSEGRYLVVIHDIAMSVSPDGKYCVVIDGASHYWVQPIDGGQPIEIKGLKPGDFPLEWHNGSQSIFVEHRTGLDSIDIYDLTIATGQQRSWTHFSPTDKTAMGTMRHPLITPDGTHALYAVQRIYSTLYLAKGIR